MLRKIAPAQTFSVFGGGLSLGVFARFGKSAGQSVHGVQSRDRHQGPRLSFSPLFFPCWGSWGSLRPRSRTRAAIEVIRSRLTTKRSNSTEHSRRRGAISCRDKADAQIPVLDCGPYFGDFCNCGTGARFIPPRFRALRSPNPEKPADAVGNGPTRLDRKCRLPISLRPSTLSHSLPSHFHSSR